MPFKYTADSHTAVKARGWIGVDLDRTLAVYDGWHGPDHIGAPIKPMVDRVKKWLAEGREVRIFTARVSTNGSLERNAEAAMARIAIGNWCREHLGVTLQVTNVKDYECDQIWDDRAVGVVPNTGEIATVGGSVIASLVA